MGFNVHRHVVLEAEMAYDFEQSKSQSITSAGSTNIVRSNVRALHFLFGPKIQTTGPVRFFALMKGGFVEFGRRGPVTPAPSMLRLARLWTATRQSVLSRWRIEFNRGKWGASGRKPETK